MTTDQILLMINKARLEDMNYLIEKKASLRPEQFGELLLGFKELIEDKVEELKAKES